MQEFKQGKRRNPRLCLVRHGETDWNARGLLQGWLDVPLNARGLAQAQALARQFQGRGFTRLWSSPLQRARQTAAVIAERLGLELRVHEGLRERHFGQLQGQAKADLALSQPALMAAIQARDPAVVFPGGESMEAFAARVQRALNEICGPAGEAGNGGRGEIVVAAAHAADLAHSAASVDLADFEDAAPILVIAHGWLLDVATRWQQGLPIHALLPHKPANGAVVWLENLPEENQKLGINACFMPKIEIFSQEIRA